MERGPGFLVDLGFEGGLQGLVRIVRAEKIGVADEEALFVVVGVDEPAGDAVGVVAADFAGIGVEDIHAVDLDLRVVVSGQWRVDSDLISALSILLISAQSLNKRSEFLGVVISSFVDKSRKVSSSAREPRAMPSD